MTYTVMNAADSRIVSLMTLDKRETNLNSSVLENTGFERSMSYLVDQQQLKIKEVVTDAHTQITSTMSKLDLVQVYNECKDNH